ncbi:TetR/AcrR family transcriptional regulator C-terminal ligand-binding domain-containing protein [Frankia sp. AgB1.9]|uniref:TetR-like C-terminal domain-containing protein n=1 Tax=unclassified Frankia TaxID=2632575 RepID=UPI0019317751|nr:MULTISPECIES: TetR-like C-terminal domain-containing protein [unclassified Frankia]MBL7492313.1 TetR/AcrR family transcriptional regulator C-terminal ligand-binding domain-containing protein [Frankia sp. AgW1.1]MBL7551862.1 TetR/AcrR family transcriptional regulator C-terminal ligand-binding domain-containing protein [Frankia sp. AgB1.9]
MVRKERLCEESGGLAITTSVSTPGSGGGSGTRRRGKVLEKAVLDAALDQLRTVGYIGLSMEGVAAAAGTGKAALYRRWANRDELVAAALSSVLPDPAELRLGVSVKEDLLALLRCIRDAIALTHGTVFQVVRSEAATAGGLMHAVVGQRVMDPCGDLTLEVLRRGIAQGELRPGMDAALVATVGPAMIVHYVVNQGPSVPDDHLLAIVDEVLMPLVSR